MNKTTTIGELVAERPTRARVFEKLGIDYCCGGKKSLEEVCSTKGIRLDDILIQIKESDARDVPCAEPDWNKATLNELIDHIDCTYHKPLYAELPRLGQLVNKVTAVHGENHPWLSDLQSIYNQFRGALENHMQREDMVLFPAIRSLEKTGGLPGHFGCGANVDMPIRVMMMEHDTAGEELRKMRELTSDYTPPEGACNSFRVMLDGLSKLESAMHQHVHKENNILFPRAQKAASGTPQHSCQH